MQRGPPDQPPQRPQRRRIKTIDLPVNCRRHHANNLRRLQTATADHERYDAGAETTEDYVSRRDGSFNSLPYNSCRTCYLNLNRRA